MSPRPLLPLVLLAEAAASAALARRRGERLAEAAIALVIAALLTTLDVAELASLVGGVPSGFFSPQTTRAIGLQLMKACEALVARAASWSFRTSIISSIALAALTVALAGKGSVVAASLAQGGLSFVQSLANAYLTLSLTFRFVGQLYLSVASAAERAREVMPAVGLLLVPRATRRAAAALLLALALVALALPLALNSLALRLRAPREAPGNWTGVGVVWLRGSMVVPVAALEDGSVRVYSEAYPLPPGAVAVLRGPGGSVFARPLGAWHLLPAARYLVERLTYAGFVLPLANATAFSVPDVVSTRLECTEEAVCTPRATNATAVDLRVGGTQGALVLFYDTVAQGWGYWLGRGFFVLAGTARRGSPLPWYGDGGYLTDHEVVAPLHPDYGSSRELRERIALNGSGGLVEVDVRVVEVEAWIEGTLDPRSLCDQGVPATAERGLSRLVINGTEYALEPKLSCEVAYVDPSLEDARADEARWFDQWARVLNASLPPTYNHSSRCFYGGSLVQALTFEGRLYYSRALWPRPKVPRVLVRAKYYGEIARPAVVRGRVGGVAYTFTAKLKLVGGTGECEAELTISNYTMMSSEAVAGLLYDSDFEPVLNGSVAKQIVVEASDLFNHVGTLATLVTYVYAAVVAIGVVGGGGRAPRLLRGLLRPSREAFELLGSGVTALAGSILSIAFAKGRDRSPRVPLVLAATDLAEELRREQRRLRMGLRALVQEGRARRLARKGLATLASYGRLHPLPALLRAFSDVARELALRRVRLDVPYLERLRLALWDPLARRLMVASDVLYAASWLLESRLLSAAPAMAFAKRLWRGYRLIAPGGPTRGGSERLRSLDESLISAARRMLEDRYSAACWGRVVQNLSRHVSLRGLLERAAGGLEAGSPQEAALKLLIVAAARGLEREEFFRLLAKYPSVALSLADLAAQGRILLNRTWRREVALSLSRLNVGASIDLGSVWLSSIERGEGWRYLAVRYALDRELTGGQATQGVPPGAKSLLDRALGPLSRGEVPEDEIVRLLESGFGEWEERFLRGFADAAGGGGVSAAEAVEALLMSGDAYWAGWVAALAGRGEVSLDLLERAVGAVAESGRARGGPAEAAVRRVEQFLERSYRGLADARFELEKALDVMRQQLALPSPGASVALRLAERREAAELAARLEEVGEGVERAVSLVNALLAEYEEVKRATIGLPHEWAEELTRALEVWRSAAYSTLNDLYRAQLEADELLKRLRPGA